MLLRVPSVHRETNVGWGILRMGKHSRNKGNAFERKVAADICKAAGVLREECYRRPLSGGHPIAGPSDLVLSNALLKRFPFSVEAKHHKGWTLDETFKMSARVRSWLKQTEDAAVKSRLRPLLVMRGNFTVTACAFLDDAPEESRQSAFLCLPRDGKPAWVVCEWSSFLEHWFSGR